MRLERIYSSKVYVTSTRKDRIHAAINSPINAELVRQLSDYLDDDSKLELKQALSQQESKSKGNADGGSADSGDSDFGGGDDFSAPRGGGGPSRPSFSGDPMGDFGDDELADIEPLDDGGEPMDTEADVEESTKTTGQSITATSTIWTTIEDVVSDCDTIKGTLNAREDTKGVDRLQVKDMELWIYYNDSANLNDKMIDVIEVLNGTGYTYLAFSRLARSNNAIVFDVNLNVDEQVKPVAEEKK